MSRNKGICLEAVQETLVLPIWGRAVETQKNNPLLIDRAAVSIVNDMDYDFSKLGKSLSELCCLSYVLRSIYFDKEIKCFLEKYPACSIVNIGCGLDTTFERVDNGKVNWYDLDFPEVIELRKKYIKETERRQFIAESVFEKGWYFKIKNKNNVLLLIAGVMYYFDKKNVEDLFFEFAQQFGKVEVLFDYSSKIGVKIANRKVIKNGGMNKNARMHWGITNIYELEKWKPNIKIINNRSVFSYYKKNYPIIKQIGMTLLDMIKINSLTHIEIIK